MHSVRERARALAPVALGQSVRGVLAKYGELTASRRPLPDFLIIGTKRGGTTSLWNYLIQHPCVFRLFPAWNTKSPHYFEENWHRGESWYRSHFPTRLQRTTRRYRSGGHGIAGDASPLYMFHPLVPERVFSLMPHVRIIVLLRDPVERAYSHWKERRKQGTEDLDFSAALMAEPARIAGEFDRMLADPNYFSQPWDWFTYRTRGQYIEQLEPWLEKFDRGQILILQSEALYRDPHGTFGTVQAFLDLPPHELTKYEVHNDRPSAPMSADVRHDLSAHFRSFNTRLSVTLGINFDWTAD